LKCRAIQISKDISRNVQRNINSSEIQEDMVARVNYRKDDGNSSYNTGSNVSVADFEAAAGKHKNSASVDEDNVKCNAKQPSGLAAAI
jgi:hypothetical protein